MNDSSESGEREIIKPTARKSIHNHDQCPFKYFEMGRYGMHKFNTFSHSNREHGTDEVDCTASKRSHSVSPLSKENKDRQRRNSLNFSHEENLEDISEDENMIAKSLPAELPSYLYSRDKHNQSSSQQYNETNENMSLSQLYKNNSNISNVNTPRVYESVSRKSVAKDDLMNSTHKGMQDKTYKSTLIIIILLALLGVIGAYTYQTFSVASKENRIDYDEWKFYNDLIILKDKYKINDNLILLLRTGISTIFEKEDTGSFVIVYNSKNNNFDRLKFYKFVNDVASTAAKYLRNEMTSNHHVEIDSLSLDVHTHSELINKYRNDVLKSGVMLVKELDRIPSNLAMAFHYYCDEYNPLVKKSAIFFTLNLENCSNFSDQKSTYALIEKCLTKRWHGMPHDNIAPLLTRVVNVVIDVTDVF